MSFGPPFFMSLDGPNGPIIRDTPVMLLSNKQEWLITKGEGENVSVLRRFVVGEPTPQWVFIPANSDAKD